MRYFKRFADFSTGFVLFMAAMRLFGEFMSTDFSEETVKLTEKLKVFFDKEGYLDNFLTAVLIALLALSLTASCVLKRFPQIALVFAVPPLALILDMVEAGRIEKYPMLYVLFAAMAVLGALTEALRRDREDGRCRGAVGSALVSFLTASYCFFLWYRWSKVSPLDSEAALELNFFDREIYTSAEDMNMKSLIWFGAAYAAIALVMLIFRDVYFVSAPLAAVPCVWLIYRWNAETLTVHPEVVVILSVVTLCVSLVCTLSGKARIGKRPKKQQREQIVSDTEQKVAESEPQTEAAEQ